MKKLIVAAVAGGLIALAGGGVAHADAAHDDEVAFTAACVDLVMGWKPGPLSALLQDKMGSTKAHADAIVALAMSKPECSSS